MSCAVTILSQSSHLSNCDRYSLFCLFFIINKGADNHNICWSFRLFEIYFKLLSQTLSHSYRSSQHWILRWRLHPIRQRELTLCSAHFHDGTPAYQATTLQYVGREISTSKESRTIANIVILAADSLSIRLHVVWHIFLKNYCSGDKSAKTTSKEYIDKVYGCEVFM